MITSNLIPSPEDLVAEIDRYAAATGLPPKLIVGRAVDNRRLYRSMKTGGGCNIITAKRLLRFIEDNPPEGGVKAPGNRATMEGDQ